MYTRRGKNPVSYSTLSVRGSTIRSWILPESLNLDALLVDDTAATKKGGVGNTGRGSGVGGSGGDGPGGMGRGRGGGGGGGGRGRGRGHR